MRKSVKLLSALLAVAFFGVTAFAATETVLRAAIRFITEGDASFAPATVPIKKIGDDSASTVISWDTTDFPTPKGPDVVDSSGTVITNNAQWIASNTYFEFDISITLPTSYIIVYTDNVSSTGTYKYTGTDKRFCGGLVANNFPTNSPLPISWGITATKPTDASTLIVEPEKKDAGGAIISKAFFIKDKSDTANPAYTGNTGETFDINAQYIRMASIAGGRVGTAGSTAVLPLREGDALYEGVGIGRYYVYFGANFQNRNTASNYGTDIIVIETLEL
jgi:hypothetical protein